MGERNLTALFQRAGTRFEQFSVCELVIFDVFVVYQIFIAPLSCSLCVIQIHYILSKDLLMGRKGVKKKDT